MDPLMLSIAWALGACVLIALIILYRRRRAGIEQRERIDGEMRQARIEKERREEAEQEERLRKSR